jgi:hypothetical protein
MIVNVSPADRIIYNSIMHTGKFGTTVFLRGLSCSTQFRGTDQNMSYKLVYAVVNSIEVTVGLRPRTFPQLAL